MGRGLEDFVRQRAGGRCEYCHDPVPPFHIEHIIARKHGGRTVAENLALSCIACNLHKGPNLSGIDPATQAVVQLYNPRIDRWDEHFKWTGPRIVGVTPAGRATVIVLEMNQPSRVAARAKLIERGQIRLT